MSLLFSFKLNNFLIFLWNRLLVTALFLFMNLFLTICSDRCILHTFHFDDFDAHPLF